MSVSLSLCLSFRPSVRLSVFSHIKQPDTPSSSFSPHMSTFRKQNYRHLEDFQRQNCPADGSDRLAKESDFSRVYVFATVRICAAQFSKLFKNCTARLGVMIFSARLCVMKCSARVGVK